METLLSSFALVAASEMGDKTQLLAFSLSARFKRPVPILAGIFVATVLNHSLAAAAGSWVAALVSPELLRIFLALAFFAFALWTLKPDSLDDRPSESRWGAFATTTILFFLAEMGDKTQLATVALGARFASPMLVTFGTTLGMMAADGLAVFAGHRLAERLPMQWIRRAAALLFLLFGVGVLLNGMPLSGSLPVNPENARRTASGGEVLEDGGREGFWIGERRAPKGLVLVAHGLNLRPSKMRAIAEVICQESTGYACRILSLPGHEESGPSRMKQVDAASWKSAIRDEVARVATLSRELHVPAYFIGYSLGGLMGEWAIQQQDERVFEKVALIAPAIATRTLARSVAYLPLPGSVTLGSWNHPDYRANPGTSLAAYRAMFRVMGEFRSADLRKIDVPTLVFLNREDELVSDRKTERWIDRSGLRNWQVVIVPRLRPSIRPAYDHLMVDEAGMGAEAWQLLSTRLREFLR